MIKINGSIHRALFELICKPDPLAHIHLCLVPKLSSKASMNHGVIQLEQFQYTQILHKMNSLIAVGPAKPMLRTKIGVHNH
jgi:hypothetical protein